MLLRFGLPLAALAAIAFLYWQNLRAADAEGYNRCLAEASANVDAVNRKVDGGNTEIRRRLIELQGRLKILSVDALTGVKNIPQCSVSECALDHQFIDKLEGVRK